MELFDVRKIRNSWPETTNNLTAGTKPTGLQKKQTKTEEQQLEMRQVPHIS